MEDRNLTNSGTQIELGAPWNWSQPILGVETCLFVSNVSFHWVCAADYIISWLSRSTCVWCCIFAVSVPFEIILNLKYWTYYQIKLMKLQQKAAWPTSKRQILELTKTSCWTFMMSDLLSLAPPAAPFPLALAPSHSKWAERKRQP